MSTEHLETFQIDGQATKIEVINNFNFLGSLITEQGGSENDLEGIAQNREHWKRLCREAAQNRT